MAKTKYPLSICTNKYCGVENGGTFNDSSLGGLVCVNCDGKVVIADNEEEANTIYDLLEI